MDIAPSDLILYADENLVSQVVINLLNRKVQIDGKSLESAENRLKNVLADFERQGYRMKNGGYVPG